MATLCLIAAVPFASAAQAPAGIDLAGARALLAERKLLDALAVVAPCLKASPEAIDNLEECLYFGDAIGRSVGPYLTTWSYSAQKGLPGPQDFERLGQLGPSGVVARLDTDSDHTMEHAARAAVATRLGDLKAGKRWSVSIIFSGC